MAFEEAIASSQREIMVKDVTTPPAACANERARLEEHGGKIHDWVLLAWHRLLRSPRVRAAAASTPTRRQEAVHSFPS